MTNLFDKATNFINRMRWAAYWFDNSDETPNDKHAYKKGISNIFPSRRSAPECDKLIPFEEALFRLIRSITFRKINNELQKQMKRDINTINNSKNIIVFADKTKNLYEMEPDEYKKCVLNSITKDYRRADEGTVDKINDEAQTIINKNQIKGKIPKYDMKTSFITIKDHKDDFPRIKKYRLINPAKTNIGKISKCILERIIMDLRLKTKLIQWKNSEEVSRWFNNIPEKNNKCFINFDICEFYPSITQEQLEKALNFAKEFTDIDEEEQNIIVHACKSILVHNGQIWQKKDGIFDIPMGSYHGAEICDLVGLLILKSLSDILPEKSFGLYRDDGLAFTEIVSPCHLERLKKKIIKKMKDIGFKITIDIGNIKTNFLDITLDLHRDNFTPYRKPNSSISYISNSSNHPTHIKKGLPKMIAKRLSTLSKSASEFDSCKQDYEIAIRNSGYKEELVYKEKTPQGQEKKTRKKQRKRKCIYFNPPYCQSIKQNIGKAFLNLVDEYFDETHYYRKIFNRSTIKISYSCMMNMGTIIKAHNNKILTKKPEPDNNQMCNCRNRTACPLNNNCLVENVIYEAEVTSENSTRRYIGSTANTFKERYQSHKYTFNNVSKPKTSKKKKDEKTNDNEDKDNTKKSEKSGKERQNKNEDHGTKNDSEEAVDTPKTNTSTELSKHIWKLKNSNKEFTIKWKILRKINNAGNTIKRICQTCNLEKMEIALAKKRNLLNKRNELVTKCPHKTHLYFLKPK